MASTSGSSVSQAHKLSCKSCRHRKIKCDRVYPCQNCQKSGHECIFPQPMRQPGAKSRNAEITQRLSRLEKLVGTLGHDPATLEKKLSQASPSHSDGSQDTSEPEKSIQTLQLQEYESINKSGGSRYMGSEFWSALSGEVDGLRQLLHEASEDEEDTERSSSRSLTGEESSPGPQMLFYNPAQKVDVRPLHPSPSHMATLGNLYFARVDPMFKVLHRPTTLSLIYSTAQNYNACSPSQEALLFSVYYAAVSTALDDRCLSAFGQSRAELLARFNQGLQQSLANADFLNSTEITTLQAFVIYIVVQRVHSESRAQWTLFSLAERIARALGLDDESSSTGLSQFEIEMRRRLWWQITVLDTYYGESRGSMPMISDTSYDTKFPLNISDDQLSPMSGVIGQEQEGATEMIFSLISYEASATIQRFAALNPRRRRPGETEPTAEEKENLIQELCQRLHTKYVAYCDGSVPVLFGAAETARIITLRLWLLMQRPMYTLRRQTSNPAKREHILASTLSCLEMVEDMEFNPTNEPWLWYMMGYVPWYHIALITAELCVQTRGWLVDRAWTTLRSCYDKWSERVADSKFGGLWRPIRKLLEKARSARLRALNQPISEEPLSKSSQDWIILQGSPLQPSQSPDYKQLHLASVALALGNSDQLESLLQSAKQMSTSSPTPPETSDAPSYSMESINWDDWDNFVQSTLNLEHDAPNTGEIMWPDVVLTTPGVGI